VPWGDNGTILIWVRESAAAIKIRVRLACFEMASPQKKRPQQWGQRWDRSRSERSAASAPDYSKVAARQSFHAKCPKFPLSVS
jgi:hypothetical protein